MSYSQFSALQEIEDEIRNAFEWLAEGVDPSQPISFVPNPGNIGDAAINLACHGILSERFSTIEICAVRDRPKTECVFVGGGGNLVEPLYVNMRDFIDRCSLNHRLLFFPLTARGYEASLRRIAPVSRMLCRERTTLAYLSTVLGPERVQLTHDAAFLLMPMLRQSFAARMAVTVTAKCRSFRNDLESSHAAPGGIDIMMQYMSDWTDLNFARDCVLIAARYLVGFDEVETDRLHCAILAAILERKTALRANAYFKNRAAFEQSLVRCPNVSFIAADNPESAFPGLSV